MQKKSEETSENPKYVGQVVAQQDLQSSLFRRIMGKKTKITERKNTFSPIIRRIDDEEQSIEEMFLTLTSILYKYDIIEDLSVLDKFDIDQLLEYLDGKLNDLLLMEKEYFDFDGIRFEKNKIYLFESEIPEPLCFGLDCYEKIEDEKLKSIVKYIIGALLVKCNFPLIEENGYFQMAVESILIEDRELDQEESYKVINEYNENYKIQIQNCISEYVKGNNDWHKDYLAELTNYNKDNANLIKELVEIYESTDFKDFSFQKLVLEHDEVDECGNEITPFNIYCTVLPSLSGNIFEEYEAYVNDCYANYEFEALGYTKEYSLEGVSSNTNLKKTYKSISKMTYLLCNI